MKRILLLLIIVLLISGCATEQECYEDYKDNQLFDTYTMCNREPSKCKYYCEKLDLEYFTYDTSFGTDCFCLNEGLPIQVY